RLGVPIGPAQVVPRQGEAHQTSRNVVEVELAVRRGRLVSLDKTAGGRVAKDAVDLARFEEGEDGEEILASIARGRREGHPVLHEVGGAETKIVALQFPVLPIRSEAFPI